MNRRKLVLAYRFAFGVTAIVLAVGIVFPLITASGAIGSRVRELTVVFASMGYGDLKYLTANGAAVGLMCAMLSANSFGAGCLIAFAAWLTRRDEVPGRSMAADQ